MINEKEIFHNMIVIGDVDLDARPDCDDIHGEHLKVISSYFCRTCDCSHYRMTNIVTGHTYAKSINADMVSKINTSKE